MNLKNILYRLLKIRDKNDELLFQGYVASNIATTMVVTETNLFLTMPTIDTRAVAVDLIGLFTVAYLIIRKSGKKK